MLSLSDAAMMAGLVTVLLAMAAYILAFAKSGARAENAALVHAGGGGATTASPRPGAAPQVKAMATVGTLLTRLAVLALALSLLFRWIAVGHGPFSNQYEFTVSFSFGIVSALAFFEWRYHVRTIALLVLPIAAAMLLYALWQESDANALVPALQNSLLLTIHVVVAIFAYGAFAVSFGAAALYLWKSYFIGDEAPSRLPKLEVLDRIGYRAIIIGFPLLTMVIVLGAVWAQIAWGSYWSWDPKETASLLTWLVYGAYLHARTARGWVGVGSAWLLVLGWLSVLLTFFGNLFFGGLHSYGA